MRFLGLSVAVILFFGATTGDAAGCTQPAQRKEWRELTSSQRSSYVNAVVCLKNTPSIVNGIRSPSRYDDFAYAHGRILSIAHRSPNFLPWHRAFLYAVELALINECGYPGTLPYWDWSVDSQSPELSAVWDSDAFGGDGDITTEERCITTGPFVNFTSTFNQRGCISRTLGEGFTDLVAFYTPELIFQLIAAGSSYRQFSRSLEIGPHDNLHSGIGGTMNFLAVSANDPIFVLHHANVDRIWRRWQLRNPSLANTYSGVLRNGQRARVSETMRLFGASGLPDWTVAMMLNTTSGDPLCYTYSNSVRAGPPIAIPTPSSTLGTATASSTLETGPTLSTLGTATTSSTLGTATTSSTLETATTSSTLGTATTSSTLETATTSSTLGTATTSSTLETATTSSTLGTATTSSTLETATTSSALGTATTSSTLGTATTSSTLGTATTSSTLETATTSSTLGTATTSSTLETATTSSALVIRPTSSASGKRTGPTSYASGKRTGPTSYALRKRTSSSALDEVKEPSLARRDNTASYDTCSSQGTMYSTTGQRSGKFSRISPTCYPKVSFKKIMDAFDAFQFGTSNKITPSCPDRTNSVKLRCPSRVSNSMLEQMGMTAEDIAELRQIENRSCSYVNYINSYFPDYQSSVALGRTEGRVEFHSVTDDEAAREHDLYGQMYTQYLNDISKTQPGLQV
ncbi:hypothetical protein BASA83_009857 [Batrachochytrium salamandrivorans]|nr:hypothetical protein BASA83_009857 [Batrachochytrium salamandrivorans]